MPAGGGTRVSGREQARWAARAGVCCDTLSVLPTVRVEAHVLAPRLAARAWATQSCTSRLMPLTATPVVLGTCTCGPFSAGSAPKGGGVSAQAWPSHGHGRTA